MCNILHNLAHLPLNEFMSIHVRTPAQDQLSPQMLTFCFSHAVCITWERGEEEISITDTQSCSTN